MGEYRTAQICLNGHIITEDISELELCENFCSQCGEPTITKCPKCNAPIRGDYYQGYLLAISNCIVPKYCYHCGKPYPWTQTAIDAAVALVEKMDNLKETPNKSLRPMPSLFPPVVVNPLST